LHASQDLAPLDGSSVLDAGPDPLGFTGAPCCDLHRGPRLRDFDGDGLAHQDLGGMERENTSLAPPAVQNLRWTDAGRLVWDPVSGAARYHVYRHDVAAPSYASAATCRDDIDPNRTDTTLNDWRSQRPAAPGATASRPTRRRSGEHARARHLRRAQQHRAVPVTREQVVGGARSSR
jgi:hypothetical protein